MIHLEESRLSAGTVGGAGMTRCGTFLELLGVGDHRTGELAAKHVTVIDIPESRDAPFPTCNDIVSMC